MRRQLTLGIFLLCCAVSQALAYDLRQHEWRQRLLFLIAPNADDAALKMQQRKIALRRDAVLDRDMLVFRLFPKRGLLGETALYAEAVEALRKHPGVAAEDRLVILIGKDRGIKRRATLDTDLREIFLQIDAMPMRRDEMRAKRDGPPHPIALMSANVPAYLHPRK